MGVNGSDLVLPMSLGSDQYSEDHVGNLFVNQVDWENILNYKCLGIFTGSVLSDMAYIPDHAISEAVDTMGVMLVRTK